METGVAEETIGGGCDSTAGEVHGLLVAHQVQGGDDFGGSVGATTCLEGAGTVSDNGHAGEAVPIAGLGSLAATP
jgi:hypothetical protein